MRQTGTTTQQMKDAPLNAIYIWVNDNVWYPKQLAFELGRTDLLIRSPAVLNHRDVLRATLIPIVIDHAARLTPIQWDVWRWYTDRRLDYERAMGKKAHS